MPQKIQPMGLAGSREAISAPTVGNASESTPVSTAKPGPGLAPGVPAGITSPVRKSSKRANPMSATHTAHNDQANQVAIRQLIPLVLRPCVLDSFVTTITLQHYLLPSITATVAEPPDRAGRGRLRRASFCGLW